MGSCFTTQLSSVETDDNCGARYWLSHLEGGTGIEAQHTIVPRLMDEAIHDDLRALISMEDISPSTIQTVINDVLIHFSSEDRQDTAKMELLYRRLGWLAAFALFIEPGVRSTFESLAFDPVIMLNKDPLWVLVNPDRLLKDRVSEDVVYREYVPFGAGMSQRKWLQSWHYNIRIHLGLATIADNGTEATYGQVIGLNQGFYSLLDNRLVHPYVWGYRNIETKVWSTTRKGDAEWEVAPVWEYPNGIVAWVQFCGEEVARGQFPISPLIYMNKDAVTSWIARCVHREREIYSMKNVSKTSLHLRDVHFPKKTSHCFPSDNSSCPFLMACWAGKEVKDLSASGEFVANGA